MQQSAIVSNLSFRCAEKKNLPSGFACNEEEDDSATPLNLSAVDRITYFSARIFVVSMGVLSTSSFENTSSLMEGPQQNLGA